MATTAPPGTPTEAPQSAIVMCTHCQEVLLHDQPFCTRCGAATAVGAAIHPHTGEWGCFTCGGNGLRLPPQQNFCVDCRWLRPLAPDYHMPVEAYQWRLDAQAMETLRSIGPLNAAAAALSNRISRPWLESSVNGIRLGADQLPDIFFVAVRAARIMGLPRMPEVYVSGDQMWDCLCVGGEHESFLVIGSVLTTLKGADLAFLIGRQMGHIAAGHALWRSVLTFVTGKQANRTIMGSGILQFLNPAKILESAIDAPLMAWARHAEITADRAGAMVVGDREPIRRVLAQSVLKSFPLYARLNLQALERDIAASDDNQMAMSEWTMSTVPYLARRLRLVDDYLQSHELKAWRAVIEHWTRPAPVPQPKPEPDMIRMNCVGCGSTMRLAKADMAGKDKAKVKCPNADCGKIMEIAPRPPDKAQVNRIIAPPPEGLKVSCPACETSMVLPPAATAGKSEIHVRCPAEACRKVLTIKLPDPAKPPEDPNAQKLAEEPRPEETVE